MRIRTIKPEFFTHEGLYDLEMKTGMPMRVAFAGLWGVADKAGRFKWQPRRIGVSILPYDGVDFSRVLDALAGDGFVTRYEVDGVVYGVIPSFGKHQCINGKEKESTLPGPEAQTAKAAAGADRNAPPPLAPSVTDMSDDAQAAGPEDTSAPREPRVEDASGTRGRRVSGASGTRERRVEVASETRAGGREGKGKGKGKNKGGGGKGTQEGSETPPPPPVFSDSEEEEDTETETPPDPQTPPAGDPPAVPASRCAHQEVPTVQDVVMFGGDAGIPLGYCTRFHARTTKRARWANAAGQLMDWRKQLTDFWAGDAAGWREPLAQPNGAPGSAAATAWTGGKRPRAVTYPRLPTSRELYGDPLDPNARRAVSPTGPGPKPGDPGGVPGRPEAPSVDATDTPGSKPAA